MLLVCITKFVLRSLFLPFQIPACLYIQLFINHVVKLFFYLTYSNSIYRFIGFFFSSLLTINFFFPRTFFLSFSSTFLINISGYFLIHFLIRIYSSPSLSYLHLDLCDFFYFLLLRNNFITIRLHVVASFIMTPTRNSLVLGNISDIFIGGHHQQVYLL